MKKLLIRICVILFIILSVGIVWWLQYTKHQYRNLYIDSGKITPYSERVPLDEIDLDTYWYVHGYSTLLLYDYAELIEAPCDIEYYLKKDDTKPALTIKKGTPIYVLPEDKDFSSTIGYGLVCWPDYEDKWRYGYPFLTESTEYAPETYTNYYVKKTQLQKIAKVFYKENQKQFRGYRSAPIFADMIIRNIDWSLYRKGIFCAPEIIPQVIINDRTSFMYDLIYKRLFPY